MDAEPGRSRTEGGIHSQLRLCRRHLPTGDVFRYFTLEIAPAAGGSYNVVDRIGKTYDFRVDHVTGTTERIQTSDTTLKPFETRQVRGSFALPLRYRLVYHFVAAHKELDDALPKDGRPLIIA